MLRELFVSLDRSLLTTKKILFSYGSASQDLILSLQHVIKKFAISLAERRARAYLDTITTRTQYLSLQVRLFLSDSLTAGKPAYPLIGTSKLTNSRNSTRLRAVVKI